MNLLFRYRWLSAVAITLFSGIVMLFLGGQVDLYLLALIFVLSALACSYPVLQERSWQSRHLPQDAIHVPAERIRKGKEYDLYSLFEIPAVYDQIRNRYALKAGDAGAPGLFLYFYLPSWLYDIRSLGPDTVYRRLAERLKTDLEDPAEVDLIAQRLLPLALGFRFLTKNAFPNHELGRWISIVRTTYFRENTWVRGVLQSPKRQFRIHAPEDNEWRTFLPFLEDSRVLAGGETQAHDFRGNGTRRLTLHQAERIGAERVEYPERVPFGSLLTYAKKGEISLDQYPEATDKLYIDRVNVLVNGSEHRREILSQLCRLLKRDVTEEDFYPLFNYGQKLRGYLPAGKAASDYVSSRGNFALYYDADRGWTLVKLTSGLVLQMQDAYWGQKSTEVTGVRSLTTSRATVMTGAPDSMLQFQISTGTPTRGRIYAADEMIEQKLRDFATARGFHILQPVGTGAEGCLFLAEKNGGRFYLKNPDGQLAEEEISTVRSLKEKALIPDSIEAFADDRIIVSPEFSPLPRDPAATATAVPRIVSYVRRVYDAGYLCLDLTPEHIRIENGALFLIDFSGYASIAAYQARPRELLADRKKIEYLTPEEALNKYSDPERLEIYLLGLLLFQILSEDRGLPSALRMIDQGPEAYQTQLVKDFDKLRSPFNELLMHMLAFATSDRPGFAEVEDSLRIRPQKEEVSQRVHS